jgi:hypothetical protein
MLASPYHVHLVSYYGRTAFNPSFSTYLGQWAPTAFSPISASLLVLAFATVSMLGRAAPVYNRYEQCLLVGAVLLALLAVRNWVFASLVLVMLAPRGFDRALRTRPARPAPAIGAAVAGVAALGALAGVVAALGASKANLTHNYPAGAGRAAAAAAAANPGAQVYAGIPFADWLLWTQPRLEGKVVFDVRYEQCLLAVAVVLARRAGRNWAVASLLLVMLVPHGLDRALRKRPLRPAPAIGALIAGLAALGAIGGVVAALSVSNANLMHDYPAEAGRTVARAAADPHAQVYAGIPFADWLLWAQPELEGKVVVDVRYELLHTSEVKQLALFDAGSQLDAPLGQPTAYVLDPNVEEDALKGLRPDVRTVYKTDQAVVAVRRNGE